MIILVTTSTIGAGIVPASTVRVADVFVYYNVTRNLEARPNAV
jgi:hypothetical protein